MHDVLSKHPTPVAQTSFGQTSCRSNGCRSVSVSRHFLLEAQQCHCSVWKRFSRSHCCRGRSKPSCWIVRLHTRWELTTWADFQLCLHRLLMRCRMEGTRDEAHIRVQLHIDLTCVSRVWPDWGAVLCCWIAKRQSRWLDKLKHCYRGWERQRQKRRTRSSTSRRTLPLQPRHRWKTLQPLYLIYP